MSLRLWEERVVPRLTDVSLRGHEIGELRGRVCAGLTGSVVEIGFGSGLNVRWCPPTVTAISAVEPSDVGWALSARRRERSQLPIDRVGLDGQHLALADASHDSALVTFSLCTIPDAALALRELRRVVRPGGRLHFLEHGLSPVDSVRRWQHRLEPVQQAVAGGCHLTREIPELVGDNGWAVEDVESFALPGPAISRPWTYLHLGTAVST
ncbi:MAG: class I SAM-dependent methyltransferase [Nocardioides sp.]|nr:class I SAM-dependent methyltransferase [Nocardioides sp.]